MEVTMKLPQTTITFSTSARKDADAINTTLTLSESEIDVATIIDALLSGSSPRVTWQSRKRVNGIPLTETISWADFITPKRAPRKQAPETVESMVMKAASDSAYKDMLFKAYAESQAREAADLLAKATEASA
jgi:hypothetical protein